MRPPSALLPWLVLLIAVGDWLALRSGELDHPPWVLAALAAGAMALLVGRLCLIIGRALRRRRSPATAAGEALLLAGVAVALGAGLANWALALHGFVVLREGEGVPLHAGAHLQHFESGPLARVEEMEVFLALAELELRPGGDGTYLPSSLLEVRRGDEAPTRVRIDTRHAATVGSLRFYQGAFGFAPRVVVVHEGRTIFDRVVPFTSERRGPRGVSFEGRFRLEERRLQIAGFVDLASLDEGLRGHATLRLEVRHDGELLGRGALLPGHFADLRDGYRVGFAGLEKWSEVDLSRRNYGGVALAGTVAALVGAAWWPLAGWRSR